MQITHNFALNCIIACGFGYEILINIIGLGKKLDEILNKFRKSKITTLGDSKYRVNKCCYFALSTYIDIVLQ